MERNQASWQLPTVRERAVVSMAVDGFTTLGVTAGPLDKVAKQIATKTKLIWSIQVEVCLDAQTEHVLCRQSVGVG